MPTYDTTRFDPPAPFAHVDLRDTVAGREWERAPRLLDCGADVTLVPGEVVSRLGVETVPDASYELTGLDGSSSFARVVRLEMAFCRRTFRGRFLLIEQEYGIIGRNVLNAIPLLLDGPQLSWSEHTT